MDATKAGFVGTIAALLLSGINLSASQLTLPILHRLDKKLSTSVFEELFYRGGIIIVPLTIIATLSAAIAAYLDAEHRLGFALAAFFSVASLPWTAIIMRPTIQLLCNLSNDEKLREKYNATQVNGLLRKWTLMNNVRSTLAGIGGGFGLATLTGLF